MRTIKLWGIVLLCMAFINHLVDALSVAFGNGSSIYRFIFGIIGYGGFIIIWRKK